MTSYTISDLSACNNSATKDLYYKKLTKHIMFCENIHNVLICSYIYVTLDGNRLKILSLVFNTMLSPENLVKIQSNVSKYLQYYKSKHPRRQNF